MQRDVHPARFRNESTPDVFVEGTVALASYPRSGNSLMRLLLEKTTGVWTGSIYHVNYLSSALTH